LCITQQLFSLYPTVSFVLIKYQVFSALLPFSLYGLVGIDEVKHGMSAQAFWLGVDPGVARGQKNPRLLPNHGNVIGFDHGGTQPLYKPKPFL
jgi:hypothetical protein